MLCELFLCRWKVCEQLCGVFVLRLRVPYVHLCAVLRMYLRVYAGLYYVTVIMCVCECKYVCVCECVVCVLSLLLEIASLKWQQPFSVLLLITRRTMVDLRQSCYRLGLTEH